MFQKIVNDPNTGLKLFKTKSTKRIDTDQLIRLLTVEHYTEETTNLIDISSVETLETYLNEYDTTTTLLIKSNYYDINTDDDQLKQTLVLTYIFDGVDSNNDLIIKYEIQFVNTGSVVIARTYTYENGNAIGYSDYQLNTNGDMKNAVHYYYLGNRTTEDLGNQINNQTVRLKKYVEISELALELVEALDNLDGILSNREDRDELEFIEEFTDLLLYREDFYIDNEINVYNQYYYDKVDSINLEDEVYILGAIENNQVTSTDVDGNPVNTKSNTKFEYEYFEVDESWKAENDLIGSFGSASDTWQSWLLNFENTVKGVIRNPVNGIQDLFFPTPTYLGDGVFKVKKQKKYISNRIAEEIEYYQIRLSDIFRITSITTENPFNIYTFFPQDNPLSEFFESMIVRNDHPRFAFYLKTTVGIKDLMGFLETDPSISTYLEGYEIYLKSSGTILKIIKELIFGKRGIKKIEKKYNFQTERIVSNIEYDQNSKVIERYDYKYYDSYYTEKYTIENDIQYIFIRDLVDGKIIGRNIYIYTNLVLDTTHKVLKQIDVYEDNLFTQLFGFYYEVTGTNSFFKKYKFIYDGQLNTVEEYDQSGNLIQSYVPNRNEINPEQIDSESEFVNGKLFKKYYYDYPDSSGDRRVIKIEIYDENEVIEKVVINNFDSINLFQIKSVEIQDDSGNTVKIKYYDNEGNVVLEEEIDKNIKTEYTY